MNTSALDHDETDVSLRQQVDKRKSKGEPPKSQFEVARKIINEEGFLGLYSGLNSALVGFAVTNGVYYYFYEFIKGTLLRSANTKRVLGVKDILISSSIAGAATTVVTLPIWTLNTRLTSKRNTLDIQNEFNVDTKPTTLSTFFRIIREDGVLGFWKGLVPALVLTLNPIIQFTLFEQLRMIIEKKRSMKLLDFFLLGAISKMVATGIMYPYIVVKSRMQSRSGSNSESRYTSIMDAFQKIIKNDGVKGLYKGVSNKLVEDALRNAILFMVKEELFKYVATLLVLFGTSTRAPVGAFGVNSVKSVKSVKGVKGVPSAVVVSSTGNVVKRA